MRHIVYWTLALLITASIVIFTPFAGIFWEIFDRPILLVPIYSVIFLAAFAWPLTYELRTHSFAWRNATGCTVASIITILTQFAWWSAFYIPSDRQGEDLSALVLIFLAAILGWFTVLAWIASFIGMGIRRIVHR